MNNKNIPKDSRESNADTKEKNRDHEQVGLDSHNTSEHIQGMMGYLKRS